MPTIAHLHVQPCPCSRCRVARNYARLLAAQALRDGADAAQPLATDRSIEVAEPERSHLDMVSHV